MEPPEVSEKQYGDYGQPVQPTFGQKLKKFLGPIGVVLVLIVKFFAKLKFIILPLLKFLPGHFENGRHHAVEHLCLRHVLGMVVRRWDLCS